MYEYNNRNIFNSRINIEKNDFEFIGILEYNDINFIKTKEQIISNETKLNDVYLDEEKVKKWIPEKILNDLKKEGNYYYLDNSYSVKLYINKKPFFNKGFCYLSNNIILIYLYNN